jgi:membrane protein
LRDLPTLLKRTVFSAVDHNCIGVAKAAAYSALLSFFPVIASSAAILAQVRAGDVSRIISRILFEVVPPGTEELVRHQFTVRGDRPIGLIVLAMLLSLWAAGGVVSSLMQGFQAAYGIERRRSIPRNSLVAVSIVLMSTVPLVIACGLILFGGHIDAWVTRWMPGAPLFTTLAWGWRMLYRVVRFIIAAGAGVAMMTLLYYAGPYRKQRWRLVWRGALMATALWLVATTAFGWYVRNMANYNVLYGSIGTSIALIVWMYLGALIALLGCEFNAVWEKVSREAARERAVAAVQPGRG